MAIEVELKAWVKNKRWFESKLKKLEAKLISEGREIDYYYSSPVKDLITIQPKEYLRVREKDGKSELGYHIVTEEDSAYEYETYCDNPKMLHKILEQIGCKVLGKIDKYRKKYTLNWKGTKITIVIDDVKDVGETAEFEIMVNTKKQIATAKQKIGELMNEFKISEEDKKVPRLSHIALGQVK